MDSNTPTPITAPVNRPCEHPANTDDKPGRGFDPITRLWWCEIEGCTNNIYLALEVPDESK